MKCLRRLNLVIALTIKLTFMDQNKSKKLKSLVVNSAKKKTKKPKSFGEKICSLIEGCKKKSKKSKVFFVGKLFCLIKV